MQKPKLYLCATDKDSNPVYAGNPFPRVCSTDQAIHYAEVTRQSSCQGYTNPPSQWSSETPKTQTDGQHREQMVVIPLRSLKALIDAQSLKSNHESTFRPNLLDVLEHQQQIRSLQRSSESQSKFRTMLSRWFGFVLRVLKRI